MPRFNRSILWLLAVMFTGLFLAAGPVLGKVAFTPLTAPPIDGPVIATATDQDGSRVFFLAPGRIHVYDMDKKAVIDTFAVDEAYDAMAYAEQAKSLILTSSRGAAPRIFRVEVVYDISVNGHPLVQGLENAPVTIAVFSDYQCPYCARIEGFLQQVAARYPEQVRVVMKNFPLASHKHARQAARAALAAARQGKFRAFHQALFKNYKEIDDKRILKIAGELKLDVDRWQKDMTDPAIDARIDRDIEDGDRIGVRGTPTVFVNGKEARMRTPQDFIAQVEAEIAAAK